MILVQGGTFQMGSGDEDANEKPVHLVTVSNFYIAKYQVTQKLWREVMGNNPSYFKNCDNCPVESISWNDAQEFVKKLNAKTGKKYRLPTEAEWEYAASGGSSRRKWAGTNSESSLDSYAWYEDNSEGKTHPVGTKSPNELGIYDMNGNVWEWCEDWYKSYPNSSNEFDYTGSIRVNRGGGWDNNASDCRVANRGSSTPTYSFNILGFRVVCDL